MRLRAPGRDDAPFLIVFIRVDHRYFQAVHQANRIDSDLAVIEPVINLFDRRSVKYLCRILKRDSLANDIAAVLLSGPTITHNSYLHNVNTLNSDN